MNLEYLTDEQVLDFTERAEEATHASAGWSMSLTETLRFELRRLGIQEVPTGIHEIYTALRKERKEREF